MLAFFIVVCSCNKDEIDYEHQRTSYFRNITSSPFGDTILTCVTYNIQLGFNFTQDPWNKETTGADSNQVKAIARLVMKADPDIIALQEVPRNRYNAVIKDFIEALADELHMNYAFGAHGYNDPYGIYPVYGEWGTAILTTYKIAAISNVEVEYVSKWEKRSMLDATIEINPARTIHALSLHHLPSEQGIPNTAAYLATVGGPVIVMGDFNYTGEIGAFKNLSFEDVDSTYENNGIDRIFYSSGHFTCQGFGVIPDSEGISDHVPNYGVLSFSR